MERHDGALPHSVVVRSPQTLLIDKGADVSAGDRTGTTPMALVNAMNHGPERDMLRKAMRPNNNAAAKKQKK